MLMNASRKRMKVGLNKVLKYFKKIAALVSSKATKSILGRLTGYWYVLYVECRDP